MDPAVQKEEGAKNRAVQKEILAFEKKSGKRKKRGGRDRRAKYKKKNCFYLRCVF